VVARVVLSLGIPARAGFRLRRRVGRLLVVLLAVDHLACAHGLNLNFPQI
jgi:hypothetical protein